MFARTQQGIQVHISIVNIATQQIQIEQIGDPHKQCSWMSWTRLLFTLFFTSSQAARRCKEQLFLVHLARLVMGMETLSWAAALSRKFESNLFSVESIRVVLPSSPRKLTQARH
eukprot:1158990-Pelagomonas_calceolata.AAC.3